MGESVIECVKQDGFIQITLNRPEALNALNDSLLDELESLLRRIEHDDKIKVGIITGHEKFFCVGADIKKLKEVSDALQVDPFSTKVQRVINLFEVIPKPFIAAISGAALGGGCEIALACDLRIASEDAIFGQPEINIGIIPGAGGTQRLPRTIGLTKAKEMLFTGGIIKADEALRIGLVNKVVQVGHVLEEAKKMARQISEKPAVAIKMTKMCLTEGLQMNLYQALAYELKCVEFLFATEDQKEGVNAFIEKRKPIFKGR
ncbi:MAG: enoyl-CoA hydratase/isomerase family protein [Deltaproteobacteria bacterium]|nr:enoyl-CoA hydratase/isomerase family protein [Deltaproteobacteria bacterium]MBW2342949.1 enoyl-CoA hydratase/isomerase family protein [Deltaproteobacteria bacterium]